MTRLLILSDLHLEFGTSLTVPPDAEYDVVVLAGDINNPGHKVVHWAQRESTFGGKPVVAVIGNHELYSCEQGREISLMRSAAEGSNVHVLGRDSITIGGVRFLGCTLWTDFAVPIVVEDGAGGRRTEVDVARALEAANRCVNDFKLIEVMAPSRREYRGRDFKRLLRAEDTLAWHYIERDWLRRQLEIPHDGPTVVVTHHAPSAQSIAPRYASDWATPAFASDLPREFFSVPKLWVHGHTHTAFDYSVGECRVVSNPRGYLLGGAEGSWENHRFDPGLVVQV